MNRFLSLLVFTLLIKIPNAQVPNSGFEQWTNLQPDYWVHNSCPFCDPPWESYIVRQDSDAYSGNYNADLYANGVFKPFAYTLFPVLNHPLKLRFHTKVSFAPCVNDSGYFEQDTVTAKVELLYNNNVVDSGYWSYSGQDISSYQLMEAPLSLNSPAFDSCRIYFEGGSIYGGCGGVAEATRFKIDDVELIFGCEAQMYYSKRIDTVNFSGISNHTSVTSWIWNFGDGNISGSPTPQHIYAQDGWYNACLTITGLDTSGNNCTATYCDSILITHDCIDTSQICPPPSLCCDAPLYEPVCGCDSVTYGNACQATLWYGITEFTQGPCITSVKKIAKALSMSLIPNPAQDKIRVNIDLQAQSVVMIKMKNLLGEIITELYASRNSQEIDISDLPQGIYFIEIWLNGKINAVESLVKN